MTTTYTVTIELEVTKPKAFRDWTGAIVPVNTSEPERVRAVMMLNAGAVDLAGLTIKRLLVS